MLVPGFGKKVNSVFVRYMASYLIILILTILIGSLAYNEALKMAKRDAIEDGLAALEKGKDILETRLKEVENMITQLSMDQEIISVLNITRPLKTQDYYKIRKAFLNLPSYAVTNNFIDDFYIFFSHPEVLISSRFISVRVPSFYEEFLKYEDMNYLKWKAKVLETYHYRKCWPTHNVAQGNSTEKKITYIQSIPLGNFDNYKGVMLVLIDEKKLLSPLLTLDIEKSGQLHIVNKSGDVVACSTKGEGGLGIADMDFQNPKGYLEKTVNREKVVVLYTSSSYMPWNYVVTIPSKVFEEQAGSIKMVFTVTIISTIFVGVVVALFLAYKNSMPLRSLIERLREAVGSDGYQETNEYDFIEGTVSKLVKSNITLQQELKNQVPFLRVGFFERLLRGEFNQLKEIETAASYANLKIKGEFFVVLLMRLNGFNGEISEENSNEIDIARVMGSKVLNENLWGQYYIHNIDEDKISILLVLDTDNVKEYEDRIEKTLGRVIDELNSNYNIRVSFGIGNVYPSLLDINRSFREACKALDYKAGGKVRRVVWFMDIPQSSTGYYYPIDLETRIINLTKVGEEKEVLSLLKHIYIRNFIQNHLSEKESEQLIYEIRGTIVKIKDELLSTEEREFNKMEELIKEMDACQSIEGIYDCAVRLYQNFCAYVNEKKQNRNHMLLENIINYINTNYVDDTLCLFSVASEFDLTEKYLSQFFKEHTGENFTSYIERIRMEKAVELLSQRDLSITDISKQVGYNNNNTFYKAFKRIYGVSPSAYRRHLK